ncbi:MAG: AsnC family transcriptional regulator [Thermoleophilaceae bacterium]|nr:AsnC family transcriptional regulator [Thermoleophilaceae bacterium]
MTGVSFITNHARVLLCIARDPGTRLRDIAVCVDLTERATHGLVSELCEAGYLTKHRLGARNFYELHPELPLRGADQGDHKVGELLSLLLDRGPKVEA